MNSNPHKHHCRSIRLPESDRSLIWQRNYYEHIIRNEAECGRIRRYIQNNPSRWEHDRLHPNHPNIPSHQENK